MKKHLEKIIAFLIFVISFGVIANASDIQFYPFPFVGKWNPTEDPMLISDYGFQDIQNVRKEGKHFKGVKGHTKINSAATSDLYVLNGFHFTKDQPAESHVIIYGADNITATTGHLYNNTTAIPGTGNFTSIYTPTSFTDNFRFSNAPSGNMVSSNAAETLIWGGNELPEVAFITSSANITGTTLTNAYDFSDILNNNSTDADQVANLSTGIDAYTVLLLHGNGVQNTTTFIDSSASNATITAVGNAHLSTYQKKFGTASIVFDGTGDYATALDSTNWYFGADPFTIDMWVRYDDVSGASGLCGQYVDANNYWLFQLGSASQYNFYIVTGGVNKAVYSFANSSPIVNTFYHLALVRNGTSLTLYINGTAVGVTPVTAISTNEVPNLAAVLEIGASLNHTNVMHGYIDELRISKGIARHTANFTAPQREIGNASNYFLVGSRRPLQGVKFYVSTANTETSTLSVKEWTGSAWSTLTATDNTSSGGKTLAQTGTVTWLSTVNSSKVRYINGLSLYWYQFYFDAGNPSIYYVTTDAPMQSIKNIWDGAEVYTVKANKYDGTTYTDYTSLLGDQDDTYSYADISALPATSSLIFGYTQPMQGFDISMVAGKVNTTASTAMTVTYWDGSYWVNVNGLSDGTATTTKSLNKSGAVIFTPNDPGTEFKQQISDTYPLYYYKVSFANALGANVQVSEVYGIPAPQPVTPYKFSATFQNRLFLFNESKNNKNQARYSAYNSPDIWNGNDTGVLQFGGATDIIAAAGIYNVFNTTGGIEQLIVTKKNETYRVTGSSPSTWSVQRISTNVGCIAPLSMVSADIADVEKVKRQVAIWMSDKGVFMTDGGTVVSISEDISCYFDPNNSKYIPAAMMAKSSAYYDPSTKSYKLLIASGSGSTYLNTELEYSLKYQEWTKIARMASTSANPLQSGWVTTDTNGGTYTYGGAKNGYVYRLENGNNWDGANITSYLWTKEIILDQQVPLFRLSTAKYLRTTHKKKNTGIVTITHYGDGVLTTSGVSGQMGPSNIAAIGANATTYDTQSVLLGPNLTHSFKFSADTNVADGLELTGLGIWYEPYTAIRQ